MKQYNLQEDNIIKTLYPNGGCLEVQKYLKRTKDSIRHRAKSLNVTRIEGFRESDIDFSELIYNFDEKSCYLLGLIWGDGTVNHDNRHYNVSVTLQEKDFNELKNIGLFNKFQIYKVKKYKESWKQTYRALVGHKKLVLFLYNNDFKNKSLISPIKILNTIPNKYHIDFIRGWFDADGCSTSLNKDNWRIIITGSCNQEWLALENFCNKYNITYKIFKQESKNGNCSRFAIYRYENVDKFLSLIYNNTNPCLSRKYNCYIEARKRRLNRC